MNDRQRAGLAVALGVIASDTTWTIIHTVVWIIAMLMLILPARREEAK